MMNLKKLLLILLYSCVSVSIHATPFWTDEGNFVIDWFDESESVFQISNASQLAGVAFLANNEGVNFGGKTIFLTADIDLAGYEWVPIANQMDSSVFSGTLEGNNHRILNMEIKEQPFSNAYALIGWAMNAKVRNLIIDSTCQIHGNNRTSGIVGNGTYVTVENCSFEGTAVGSWYVSGIVGYGYAVSITNCINTGTLNGDGYVGGIMGSAYKSPIENCCNQGIAKGYSSIGGIAGFFGGPVAITDCYNNGPIEGSYYTGGLLGKSYEFALVKNSHNNAPIVCFTQTAGGIVGSAGEVTNFYNCYNFGTIDGADIVGGIVGEMCDSTSFNNCYNAADLRGNEKVGGIAGICLSETRPAFIRNCYNVGKISGNGNLGGIVAVAGNFFDGQACGFLDTCIVSSNGYGDAFTSDYLQSDDYVAQLNSFAAAQNEHDTVATWLMWNNTASSNYLYPVLDGFVGISQNIHSEVEFSLFPNPALSYFNVEVDEKFCHDEVEVRVYAINGFLKLVQRVNASQFRIDVNGWTKGVYVVVLSRNGKAVGHKKVVVV